MTARGRLTAAERGEEVLRAAVKAFGASGYAGTTTDEIARLAGVSQPYVVRLFGTKQRLFLAALESVCDRLEQAFRDAAEREPTLISLSSSFETMLSEEEVLRILLHGCSASAEPAIGDVVRERFARVYRMVRDLTGASPAQAREFLGSGVLLTAMSAMDPRLIGGSPAPWADELMASLDSTGD